MPVHGHRPYAHHTPLGREMWELGLRVKDVTRGTRISERILSDYLADRRPITLAHLHLLADFLDVDPDELIPPAMPDDGTIHIGPPPEPQPLRVKRGIPHV